MAEYNRVSLPCLGSFLGQYAPARISDDGSTIFPPCKRIDFHQNEIWNDEKLEKLIARRQKISLGRAKELVAFWIDDICLALSTGGEVSLDGLGTFSVNTDNKLVFEQQTPQNLLLESFGLEAVSLPVQNRAVELDTPQVRPSAKFVEKLKKKRRRNTFFKVVAGMLLLKVGVMGVLVYLELVPGPMALKDHLFPPKAEATATITNDTIPARALTVAPKSKDEVYRIKLGSYEHYNEARAHVRQLEEHGFTAMIFYMAGDSPYNVYLGVYDTHTSGQVVLDYLIRKDSLNLFTEAKVDIAPKEGELGL